MNRFIKKLAAVFSAAAIAVSAFAVTASADFYEKQKLPTNEAMVFVDKMGAGWNLGNCFDASDCTWLNDELAYESAWCGAKATKTLISSIKAAGFNTIRVPVSWHNHVDADFNISEVWMNRVKEVIDWCVDEDLYIIINVHHDVEKGFYYPSKAEYAASEKYMTAVWTQICDTFKNYDEKLIFEIINEPRLKGTNLEWWYNTPANPPKEAEESLDCINKLNQVSLDVIRKSGGKNKKRYVLVGGYDTDGTDKGILSKYFVMPTDTVKNRLIADIHYYGLSEREYKWNIDNAYKTFVSEGIPVIYSEYGLSVNNYDYVKNHDAAVKKMGDFAAYARSRGCTVVMWDNNAKNQFKFIQRASGDIYEKDIVKAFTDGGAGSSPIVTATAGKGSVSLSWTKVSGATKYAVYRYTNGKLTAISKNVKKTSCSLKSLKSGKTYKFVVKAYVNGKWTEVKKSDIVSVKIK